MKKNLKAGYIDGNNFFKLTDAAIAEKLDSLDKNHIAALNWPEYFYQPSVHFSIAYQEDHIFLKYYVAEKDIRATYGVINDPVYRDSCVEFFISIDDDQRYYNFEFNCIGTCRAAYGANRVERDFLPKSLIETIGHQSSFKLNNGLVNWELTLSLPKELFCHHSLVSFKGLRGKANFYKCGDDLPVPHFLSWNPIDTATPDFHQPLSFGELMFP